MRPTKAHAADYPSYVLIARVLPVILFQVVMNCADNVHFYRWSVLCSVLSYDIDYSCSRSLGCE